MSIEERVEQVWGIIWNSKTEGIFFFDGMLSIWCTIQSKWLFVIKYKNKIQGQLDNFAVFASHFIKEHDLTCDKFKFRLLLKNITRIR